VLEFLVPMRVIGLFRFPARLPAATVLMHPNSEIAVSDFIFFRQHHLVADDHFQYHAADIIIVIIEMVDYHTEHRQPSDQPTNGAQDLKQAKVTPRDFQKFITSLLMDFPKGLVAFFNVF
jgi:hypothetical protein